MVHSTQTPLFRSTPCLHLVMVSNTSLSANVRCGVEAHEAVAVFEYDRARVLSLGSVVAKDAVNLPFKVYGIEVAALDLNYPRNLSLKFFETVTHFGVRALTNRWQNA